MFLAFKLSDIVTVPFGWLMGWLYQVTNNYGIAMILFAVCVQMVLLPITAKQLPGYGGNMDTAAADLSHYQKMEFSSLVLCGSRRRAELLQELLREKNISAFLCIPLETMPGPGQILLTDGTLPFLTLSIKLRPAPLSWQTTVGVIPLDLHSSCTFCTKAYISTVITTGVTVRAESSSLFLPQYYTIFCEKTQEENALFSIFLCFFVYFNTEAKKSQ